MNAIPKIPVPTNEPVLSYAPGAPERIELKRTLKDLSSHQIEIPLVIGGKEVRTGKTIDAVMPHCHRHVLAKVHQAGPAEVQAAIRAAREAWLDWSTWEFERRAAVFLKAADLLATRYRPIVNAATMLGQSKTAHQAEIDSACELIDFFRFNPHYAERLYTEQPISATATWNYLDYRPLEGFVYAITPFNFTSIGGNLPTAPAIMGNTVVWKPAGTAAFSNYFILKLLEDAGLPPGVINFVPGPAVQVSDTLLADRGLAGIHFTGSTEVFQALWKLVGERLAGYAGYPRLVGETGGKDFILAHASADIDAVATGIVRGAYEYQGQKCSAASRAYVPDAVWPRVRERVLEMLAEVKMGDPADFRNFVGAVIDRKAFDKIKGYIEAARQAPGVKILAGGRADDTDGYFIEPTLIQADDPGYRTMREEVFGPVLTVHVYPAARWADTLRLVDETTPYALTGAVFAQDRRAVDQAQRALRYAAGNFYVNDKPTGAVVGQQPFGGARASGTNDKAGSLLNLIRWVSPRAVKENFLPPRTFTYPFMAES
ncbi:MAG: 1-pyrroline-5-carboxylate dehydrogenase [Gemmatimonadetes bacterium 13_1_20CM_4_69_16]|nr:MAG: 1-pyrroline-5-carboxylate dehydrogenase [Gemmatimonadetes bacterium 13_1_20CM_4_69_16]